MMPSDAISPLIGPSSRSSNVADMLWKIRFTVCLLTTHIVVLLLFLFAGCFDYSPYGKVHHKETIGFWQIASAPIFIHNSKNWLLSILAHPIAVIVSCLEYKETNGHFTRVTCFSLLNLLRETQSFLALGGLEYIFHSAFPYRQKFTFGGLFIALSYSTFLFRTGVGLASFHLGHGLLPSLTFSDGMRQVSTNFYHILIPLFFIVYRLTSGLYTEKIFKFNPLNVLFLCLIIPVNNGIWWNMSGLIIGILTLVTLPSGNMIPKIKSTLEPNHERSFWMNLSLKTVLFSAMFCLSYWFTQPKSLKAYKEVTCFGDPTAPLITFVIMTAPRVNDARPLFKTVASYLDAFPSDPKDPLYSRVKLIVFTHFSEHKIFDRVRAKYVNDTKAQHYLQFIRKEGSEFNQKKHFDAAIKLVAESLEPQTHYIGIIEDDFPLCPGKLKEVFRVVRDANRLVPEHCGIFIGTGGSGLLIRHSSYQQALKAMDAHILADIGLQDCLRGTTCKGCQLVIPSKLLMFHTGHDISTMDHSYPTHIYQCGHRHPLLSDLDVAVV